MRPNLYARLVWTGMFGFGIVIEYKFSKRVHVLFGPVSIEVGLDH